MPRNTFVVHPYKTCGLQQQRNCAIGPLRCNVLHVCIEFACIHVKIIQLVTRLDVCVSSLRRGHAKRIEAAVQQCILDSERTITGIKGFELSWSTLLKLLKWKDSSSRTMRTLRAIRSTLRSTIREGAALHANRNTSRSVRVILAQEPCEADCHNRVEI